MDYSVPHSLIPSSMFVGRKETYPDYLLKSLRDFRSRARAGRGGAASVAMADVVQPLDDAQMRALSHCMAYLP